MFITLLFVNQNINISIGGVNISIEIKTKKEVKDAYRKLQIYENEIYCNNNISEFTKEKIQESVKEINIESTNIISNQINYRKIKSSIDLIDETVYKKKEE